MIGCKIQKTDPSPSSSFFLAKGTTPQPRRGSLSAKPSSNSKPDGSPRGKVPPRMSLLQESSLGSESLAAPTSQLAHQSRSPRTSASHRPSRVSGTFGPRRTPKGSMTGRNNLPRIDNAVTFQFEIEDTGYGIPTEHREAMFQNFVALPNSSTRYGGTGVGLGIVRSLIQLMGGNISIIDKATPGVLFRYTITLEKQQATLQGEAMSEAPMVQEGEGLRAPATLSATSRVQSASDCAGPGVDQPALPADKTARLSNPTIGPSAGLVSISKLVLPSLRRTRKILLVMPEGRMQAEVAARWFTRRGCEVSKESSWEGVKTAVEGIFQQFDKQMGPANQVAVGRRTTPIENIPILDEENFRCLVLVDSALIPKEENVPSLQKLETLVQEIQRLDKTATPVPGSKQGIDTGRLGVVLLTTAATLPAVQRTAKACGCQLLQKPLVPSRITPLLAFFDSKGDQSGRENASTSAVLQRNSSKIPRAAPTPGEPSGVPRLQSFRQARKALSEKEGDGKTVGKHFSEAMITTPREADAPVERVGDSIRTQGDAETMPDVGTGISSLQEAVEGESARETVVAAPIQVLRQSGESKAPVSEDVKENVKEVRGEGKGLARREGNASGSENVLKRAPQVSGSEAGPALVGLQILLVEDTPVMAQIARKQMEKLGSKVRWAQDGQVAVEIFSKVYGDLMPESGGERMRTPSQAEQPMSHNEKIDIIVMDCQMPRLDGYGATAAIRKLEKSIGIHTPIIALTAHAMTTDRQKCLDAGMDDYLAKPLNLAVFKTMVETLLSPKEASDVPA